MAWSRHPSRFMSVVFPEPEAPIKATNSPRSIVKETSFRTGRSTSPEAVRLVRCVAVRSGPCAVDQ